MIFVTLGTQKEPFTRLLDYIEKADTHGEKIIVQAGHTNYKSNKMEILSFISNDQLTEYFKKANIVITHGGTGSVLTALKNNKKIIACARLKKYNEHVDDHQKELIKLFRDRGHLIELNEATSLNKILTEISNFVPKPYVSNTNTFIEYLVSEIES